MDWIRAAAGLTLLTALFTAVPAQAAGIYKWVDDQGHIHYSQVAPTGRDRKQVHVQRAPGTSHAQPVDVGSGGSTAADPHVGATGASASGPACETISCRARRLEAERIRLEQARQDARYARAKPRGPAAGLPADPADPDCQTMVCRANRLEAQRLEHERALRAKRYPQEKPLSQAERNARFETERKAAADRMLVEECEKRRDVYCDKGPAEIRKQLEWKAQQEEWARQRKLRFPAE